VSKKISSVFYASYFFHCWGQIWHLAYDMGGQSEGAVRKSTHNLSSLSGKIIASETELALLDQRIHGLSHGKRRYG